MFSPPSAEGLVPIQREFRAHESWRWHRGLLIPGDLVVHHDDVPVDDRVWFGPVPITSPRRTLEDCARGHLSPDLLCQAARQALRRGLVVLEHLPEVEKALAPFGGIVG